MSEGVSVRVVVGYQLQCAVLEKGWPQSGSSISGALRQAKTKGKGKGKEKSAQGGGPPLAPLRVRHRRRGPR
eukprot:1824598-Pyramimonas_sp.AAC.1